MAKKVGTAGFNLLCIDTENKFVSTGFAEEIAKKAQVRQLLRLLPTRGVSSVATAASVSRLRGDKLQGLGKPTDECRVSRCLMHTHQLDPCERPEHLHGMHSILNIDRVHARTLALCDDRHQQPCTAIKALTRVCCGLTQGKYYYLPNANDAAIAMAASSAMAEAKAA